MYNEDSYNIAQYNEQWTWTETVAQDDIVYNGLSLQNENFIISETNFDSSHNIENATYNRPLTDWIWELNYFFREKLIRFIWTVKASNAEELNNEIDRIKKIVLQNNKDLDVKVNWTIRRAKASCVNPPSLFNRRHYNITFIPIVLEFRINEFMKETIRNNLTLTWQTAWFVEEIFNIWSAKANPLITITINSASWVNEIIFTNNETITINETIGASDIIKIDTEEKQVLINDVDVDYSWTFPRLDPWVNNFQLQINWTVNYDFNLSYFNTYL